MVDAEGVGAVRLSAARRPSWCVMDRRTQTRHHFKVFKPVARCAGRVFRRLDEMNALVAVAIDGSDLDCC